MFRIRIRRIHVFGPPGSGSISQRYGSRSRIWIQIQIRILLSSSNNNNQNIDSYCSVTSLWIFNLKNDENEPSKSTKQKNGNISKRYGSADPDPCQNFMNAHKVADPGSGALLTSGPGSGIGFFSRSGISNPKPMFLRAWWQIFG